MDVLMIPGVSAIVSLVAMSWACSLSISLLALFFVSGVNLRHWVPDIKAVVGLVSLAMLTVHASTGQWLLF